MYVVVVGGGRNLYEVGVGKRGKLGEEAGKKTVFYPRVPLQGNLFGTVLADESVWTLGKHVYHTASVLASTVPPPPHQRTTSC